tara:strand:+ start:28970 stop:29419 length:450 start_codon:yes stop_codon:yes gene_type:complete
MADFDTLSALKPLVQSVPDLAGGRTLEAADLAELIRQQALPNNPATAFLVPTGLRPRGEGDAGASAFIQSIDEMVAVVLVVRTAADVTGAKGLPRVNALVWAVIGAVAGGDVEDAIGVFRFAGGQLHSVTAGAIFYQVNFAIQLQLRSF